MKQLPAMTLALGIVFPAMVGTASVSHAQDPSTMTCGELWYARNKIYADEGYCFGSPRARAVFGTSCSFPYGRLNPTETRQMNILQSWERRRSCSKDSLQAENSQAPKGLPRNSAEPKRSAPNPPAPVEFSAPAESSAKPAASPAAPVQPPPQVEATSQQIIPAESSAPVASVATQLPASQSPEQAAPIPSAIQAENPSDGPTQTYLKQALPQQDAASYASHAAAVEQDSRFAHLDGSGSEINFQGIALPADIVFFAAAVVIGALLTRRTRKPSAAGDKKNALDSSSSVNLGAGDTSAPPAIAQQSFVEAASNRASPLDPVREEQAALSSELHSDGPVFENLDSSAELLGFKRVKQDRVIAFYKSEVKSGGRGGAAKPKVADHHQENTPEPRQKA